MGECPVTTPIDDDLPPRIKEIVEDLREGKRNGTLDPAITAALRQTDEAATAGTGAGWCAPSP